MRFVRRIALLSLASLAAAPAVLAQGGMSPSGMAPASSAGTLPPPVPRGAPSTNLSPMAMPAPGTERAAPTPAQPFSNLNLPKQDVGNGAYNGGGIVLEYSPDGTSRLAR
ncbi:hypothetical protein ACFOD4_09845 [Pseudoroseomonas globiformis]|uniref:Uncharacterized protein n=1 Tax=Teichococcus globiformis TaxID=2307229 RepID=A0ABV7G2K4_9PROT